MLSIGFGLCSTEPREVSIKHVRDSKRPVVLDTNVFITAGFNPGSASAHIVEAVRAGRLWMAWNEETRAEIEHVLWQIPPLSWGEVSDLFRQEWREKSGPTESFGYIPDAADRKFAALAGVINRIHHNGSVGEVGCALG